MTALALAPPQVATRAGTREWAGLAVLFLPTLIVAIDNTVLGFALPAMSAALAPTSAQLLWIVDIYPLVLAGLLVTMGNLGDRIGRRRILLLGVAGFGAVSLAAAFATDAAHLIAARALLGFFGAMLMPATLALLRTLFVDPNQRRIAVAIWTTGFAAGAALGPIVGGVLLEHFTWGSVFLVNVPVMLLLLVLGRPMLPESRMAEPGRLDPSGVLLSMLVMVPAVLAIKTAAHDGLSGSVVLAVMVSAGAAVLFARRARAQIAAGQEPVLDVTLLVEPVARLSVLSNAATMFAHTGLLFFAAQYLMLVVGLSPLDASMVLVPGFLATMATGLIAARLAKFVPLRTLVPAGLLIAAAGYVAAMLLGGEQGVTLMAVAAVLVGGGIGLAEAITTDAVLAAVPPERAGSASAVSETAFEIGAVLGTAILGSVLTSVYRANVVVPSALSPEDAVVAQETLGGAAAVAHHLGGAGLLGSAREAFGVAVDVTAGVGAVVMVAVAATVWFGPRRQRAAS
ncbi:MFS transporter [Pseudonocardia sp. TRM90224]|uniref:MFS transporter n=1 Tax=Pseudonocardia sp. TRM90224 TaxID=2812678 RepID=UPI001E4AA3AB|nr:MFS transporter [Pseudonocardia sp. TRM90224]